jgi:medium-chain acyl-[acyl-carrier-protein] hydrolase
MSSLPVFSETLRIKSYETDFRDRWKPHCLQQALQEASSNHAALLGYGYREMFERGMAWVLSRMRIDFFEMPRMGDLVTLRTWPKGVQQRLFFTRDFTITAANGQPVAAATFGWVLVDLVRRRVLPPSALPGDLPQHAEDAIPDLLEKITVPAGLPALGTWGASYSVVDTVGHANSARYVEWILDGFPFESFQTRCLSRLQVNFSTEIKPGEHVAVAAGQVEERWLAQGTILESGTRAFDAWFDWKTIA